MENLLPFARKIAAASMALNLDSVKPIGNFKVEIVYPEFVLLGWKNMERKSLLSSIQSLMEKINNKHCQ